MTILMVNKFHYLRGGAERYVFDLTRLLQAQGHRVIHFTTAHPKNAPLPPESIVLEAPEFDDQPWSLGALRVAARVVHSRPAARAMAEAVERFRPDLVHLHNIAHHFSPSILGPLARRRVPTVQTLHDFKLICPTYLMVSGGRICERCQGKHFVQAVLQRCNRGSLARSTVSAVESYVHRFVRSYDSVASFLCPSRFLLEKMAANGVPRQRLVHLPLMLDTDRFAGRSGGDCVIFVGRLSREKGVHVLLEAAAHLPQVPFMLVGDGPERQSLAQRIQAEQLAHVRLCGRLEGEALITRWRTAALTLVPSITYENFPLAVVESMALGKPVVASRLGGMAELVEDGVSGALVEPGDAPAWAEAIGRLWGDRARLATLGSGARAAVTERFEPQRHYEELLAAYATAGVVAA